MPDVVRTHTAQIKITRTLSYIFDGNTLMLVEGIRRISDDEESPGFVIEVEVSPLAASDRAQLMLALPGETLELVFEEMEELPGFMKVKYVESITRMPL